MMFKPPDHAADFSGRAQALVQMSRAEQMQSFLAILSLTDWTRPTEMQEVDPERYFRRYMDFHDLAVALVECVKNDGLTKETYIIAELAATTAIRMADKQPVGWES